MKNLCTPAHIYLIFAIISLVLGAFYQLPAYAFIAKAIGIFIWTYLLNFLCSKGYSTVSWILALLPFIIIVGAILSFIRVLETNENKQENHHPSTKQHHSQYHKIIVVR